MSASRTRSALLSLLLLAGLLPLEIQVRSQVALRVGYAVITADPGGRAPVGSALLSVRNLENVLVLEAGVPAVEPIRRGRVFVDQRGGMRTGVAWASPFDEQVTLRFSDHWTCQRLRGPTPKDTVCFSPKGLSGRRTFTRESTEPMATGA